MTSAPGASAIPASCVTALETGCGDYLAPDPLACSVKGTLTDGTACEFDNQCASGRCGSAGGTPGCGICKPASEAGAANAGGTPERRSCTNEGRCATGLSCIDAGSFGSTPTPGTCAKTRALGEACSEWEDCNTGSHGDFGWMAFTVACIDGGCAKPFDEGADCTGGFGPRDQCDIHKKLLCASGKCAPWPFNMANEPCTKNNEVPNGSCRGDFRCIGEDASGTCVPVGLPGSPCTVAYGCRWGLACDNGVCTRRPADYCK